MDIYLLNENGENKNFEIKFGTTGDKKEEVSYDLTFQINLIDIDFDNPTILGREWIVPND